MLVLLYRMWAALPKHMARTTPSNAVCFLFIPLVGLFWLFWVLWGWARDFNKTVRVYGLEAKRISEGLAIAACLLLLLAGLASNACAYLAHVEERGRSPEATLVAGILSFALAILPGSITLAVLFSRARDGIIPPFKDQRCLPSASQNPAERARVSCLARLWITRRSSFLGDLSGLIQHVLAVDVDGESEIFVIDVGGYRVV